jgi:hypothetical protein
MRVFFKYLLWLLSLLTLITFLLVTTKLGNHTLGSFLGYYLSNKTHNKVEVELLNFEHYPKLLMEIKINDGAKVHLEGQLNTREVDMVYHLKGNEYRWNGFIIESGIDVKGTLNGTLLALNVQGEGTVFDGFTQYSFTKVPSQYIDMKVQFKEVKSQELLKFFNKKALFRGRINIESVFKHFSNFKKDGFSKFYMSRGFMPKVAPYVPFVLEGKVLFKDISYTINGQINSDIGTLKIDNGHYHKTRKEGGGNYDLKLSNLAYFEEILKHRVKGGLKTTGKFSYKENTYELEGQSSKFDGVLTYHYKNEMLELNLEGVSLLKILQQFEYPELLSAKVYGKVDANIKEEIVIVNTDLKEVRLKETKTTKMILKATGVDMIADVYDKSSFVAGYQNEKLNTILKIDNGVNHLYLTETQISMKTKSIDSRFDMRMKGQELSGKLYGTLEHPKVTIDMQRLIKYQVDKNLKDGIEGIKNKLNKFFH